MRLAIVDPDGTKAGTYVLGVGIWAPPGHDGWNGYIHGGARIGCPSCSENDAWRLRRFRSGAHWWLRVRPPKKIADPDVIASIAEMFQRWHDEGRPYPSPWQDRSWIGP